MKNKFYELGDVYGVAALKMEKRLFTQKYILLCNRASQIFAS
jgi:hypothetical protein